MIYSIGDNFLNVYTDFINKDINPDRYNYYDKNGYFIATYTDTMKTVTKIDSRVGAVEIYYHHKLVLTIKKDSFILNTLNSNRISPINNIQLVSDICKNYTLKEEDYFQYSVSYDAILEKEDLDVVIKFAKHLNERNLK